MSALSPDIRFRRVFDEGVVVRQEAGEVLGVNEVGVRILELLREGHDEEAVVARLEDELEVEPERLRRDVEAFLRELREAGVVR